MIGRLEARWRRVRRLFDRARWTVRLFGIGTAPPDEGSVAENPRAGLVLVQLDGLGREALQRALERGEMPFLARLLARERYALHDLYSGLPSSTPAVQAELFYGARTAVPAFAFLDRRAGLLRRMYDPDSARAIETRLAARGEPLLAGGSAYCDIYTGGAAEAHFCAASLGWSELLDGVRPLAWTGVALLYLPLLLRAVLLTGLELVLALGDVVRGWWRGYDALVELKFVVSRMGISILLRDLITIGACADVARGLPVVHLNYLGYDEQAHRRGPDSWFAHRSLRGMDRCLQRLWRATHGARHRHYDLWIYADHGQEATTTWRELTGHTIEDTVREALAAELPAAALRLDSLDERIAGQRARLLGGHRLQRIMASAGAGPPGPRVAGRSLVAAMGPVGHVYLDAEAPTADALQRLARRLVERGRVPGVLWIDDDGIVRARVGDTGDTAPRLPEDAAAVLGASHPYLHTAARDLVALVRHADAGSLVLLGCVAGSHPVSFPLEHGAHAGAGPRETRAFALLPGDVRGRLPGGGPFRPLDLRHRALRLLGRDRAPARHRFAVQGGRPPAGASRRGVVLRVTSYNVHSCIGMDGRLSPERIARVIARDRPDIVALQELDCRRDRSLGVDQAHRIARLLEMEYRFHPAFRVEEEEYGDAILTRLPVLASRTGALPTPPGREPRGALWLTLELEGRAIQVLNTHLGLGSGERLAQVCELVSERWLAHPECTGPTLLCGDFNATPRSRTLAGLTVPGADLVEAQMLVPGPRLRTFPGRRPSVCIDHVLVRGVADVRTVQVPCDALSRLASDHLPLVVDVELPAG